MALSDNELLANFLADDGDAFRQLVERYRLALVNYLYRFLGNRDIAEEVAQETFMAIFTHAGQFKQDASFRAWLYAIATNRARNAMRRRQPLLAEEIAEAVSDFGNPIESAARQEMIAAVRQAMEKLSEEHRAVFLLRFYQGLSYEEIAIALGCPTGTVKSRMCYALKRMRGILWKFHDHE